MRDNVRIELWVAAAIVLLLLIVILVLLARLRRARASSPPQSMAADPSDRAEPPPRTMRLTFEYRGPEVRLASQTPVEMLAPPSDQTEGYAGQSGFWVELRDARDAVVYRRVMRHPIQFEPEAPTGSPESPFTRGRIEQVQGTFVVLVPDLGHARGLRLVGSPPEQPASAAQEILRAALEGGHRDQGVN
jgi:hypothetical protein